jgi:hypothetical protein
MPENVAARHAVDFIRQQSTLLAVDDAFLLGASVFIALAAFVWLARPAVIPGDRAGKLRRVEAQELMEQG